MHSKLKFSVKYNVVDTCNKHCWRTPSWIEIRGVTYAPPTYRYWISNHSELPSLRKCREMLSPLQKRISCIWNSCKVLKFVVRPFVTKGSQDCAYPSCSSLLSLCLLTRLLICKGSLQFGRILYILCLGNTLIVCEPCRVVITVFVMPAAVSNSKLKGEQLVLRIWLALYGVYGYLPKISSSVHSSLGCKQLTGNTLFTDQGHCHCFIPFVSVDCSHSRRPWLCVVQMCKLFQNAMLFCWKEFCMATSTDCIEIYFL